MIVVVLFLDNRSVSFGVGDGSDCSGGISGGDGCSGCEDGLVAVVVVVVVVLVEEAVMVNCDGCGDGNSASNVW